MLLLLIIKIIYGNKPFLCPNGKQRTCCSCFRLCVQLTSLNRDRLYSFRTAIISGSDKRIPPISQISSPLHQQEELAIYVNQSTAHRIIYACTAFPRLYHCISLLLIFLCMTKTFNTQRINSDTYLPVETLTGEESMPCYNGLLYVRYRSFRLGQVGLDLFKSLGWDLDNLIPP